MVGQAPGLRPTPSSASLLSMVEEPDRGSGADESACPTKTYGADTQCKKLDVIKRSAVASP